jgi:hypothetical protein
MIKVDFENRSVFVERNTPLRDMIKMPELLELSLPQWRELLIAKGGICTENYLLQVLDAKIKAYDQSPEVNGFFINGNIFWLDKATRVGLAHLADCTEGDISLVLGTVIIQINSAVAKELLAQLERYAAECYLMTAKHLLAINELRTVEELLNYDYTKGYPEKLTFNV